MLKLPGPPRRKPCRRSLWWCALRGETRCFSLSTSPWLKDRDGQRQLFPRGGGGGLTYPTWSAPSTEDRREDPGLCTRLVSGTFHDFAISSCTSGKKGPGLHGGCPFGGDPTGSTTRPDQQEAPTPNRAHQLPWRERLGARLHYNGGPPRSCRGAQCNPVGC